MCGEDRFFQIGILRNLLQSSEIKPATMPRNTEKEEHMIESF
jgi:hypothetical protein